MQARQLSRFLPKNKIKNYLNVLFFHPSVSTPSFIIHFCCRFFNIYIFASVSFSKRGYDFPCFPKKTSLNVAFVWWSSLWLVFCLLEWNGLQRWQQRQASVKDLWLYSLNATEKVAISKTHLFFHAFGGKKINVGFSFFFCCLRLNLQSNKFSLFLKINLFDTFCAE